MVFLSLGPQVIAAALSHGDNRANGPDLVWLLFGPDMAQGLSSSLENEDAPEGNSAADAA